MMKKLFTMREFDTHTEALEATKEGPIEIGIDDGQGWGYYKLSKAEARDLLAWLIEATGVELVLAEHLMAIMVASGVEHYHVPQKEAEKVCNIAKNEKIKETLKRLRGEN